MRKYLFILFLFVSSLGYSQIIADHTVVDLYDDIPQQWIDSVKTMWLSYAGESHSDAILDGLESLEAASATYAINVTTSGTPEGSTSSYLRVSEATWGDYDNSSGWIYDYGQEDWITGNASTATLDPVAVARTKAGITYSNSNDLTISAFGFGWCYDCVGIDTCLKIIDPYITATKDYIDYCADSIDTKVFFTTGPIDSDLSTLADASEKAYTNSVRWDILRDTVANDESRILFDYADILSYNNDGEQQTQTWDGHTYPVIHPDNAMQGDGNDTGHIGEDGSIRLAKAMWWMLAKMAGWGESSSTTSANKKAIFNNLIMYYDGKYIIINNN